MGRYARIVLLVTERRSKNMEHIHTLVWVKRTPYVNCSECGLQLRLASYTEACYIYEYDAFGPDGPMVFTESGSLVVPLNYAAPINYVKEKP
jgi:hypothetical protein